MLAFAECMACAQRLERLQLALRVAREHAVRKAACSDFYISGLDVL